MKISKRELFTNPNYNKISSIPISNQILFWLGYFAFNTFRWGSFYDDYAYSFKSNELLNSHFIFFFHTSLFFTCFRNCLMEKWWNFLLIIFISLGN